MINFDKSYGTITGHSWAKYEQNGTLYDADGKSYDEQAVREEPETPDVVKPEEITKNAREWLQEFLAEGPMARDVVNAESGRIGYPWVAIKDAAQEMKVKSYKLDEKTFWRLPIE